MKKVAALTLIFSYIAASSMAVAQPTSWSTHGYTSNSNDDLSPVTKRRVRKILGPSYDQRQTADQSYADGHDDREGKKKKRSNDPTYRDYKGERRDRQQGATDPYPDYKRPDKLIEMSLRFSPVINSNTAEGTGNYQHFAPNGVGVRPSVGVSLDYFFFKDRYAFSSGIWYTIKRSGYVMPGSFGQTRWDPAAPAKRSVYNLQYAQIPVTVKLFANNLFPDARLYLQTGGLVDIKLAERALYQERNGLYLAESGGDRRQYGFADFTWLLGAGVQYKLSRTNALNMGISYQRGLLDIARGRELQSKQRIVALEVGLKF